MWLTDADVMRSLGRCPCISSDTAFPLSQIEAPTQWRELESCGARR